MEIKYKQFVIVPKKPRMSKGKIASQVAHATFMALDKEQNKDGSFNINAWKRTGMCVIVLECPTQIELMNWATYLKQWDVHHHLYIDEGITEIPGGTATALATGVLTEDQWWMLSQMRLFK